MTQYIYVHCKCGNKAGTKRMIGLAVIPQIGSAYALEMRSDSDFKHFGDFWHTVDMVSITDMGTEMTLAILLSKSTGKRK